MSCASGWMRDLFSSRVGRWFRRPTTVLTVVVGMLAACGGGDENNGLFPQPDSGTDSRGTADRGADTPTDRGVFQDTGGNDRDAAREVGQPDEGTDGLLSPDADGAPPDVSLEAEAGPGDARVDGDAKLDAPAEAAAPICTDQVKNGNETDIDCGGMCAPTLKCGDGKGCSVAGDCQSGVCPTSKVCAVPSCADTVKNGTETDIDCGGAGCLPNKKGGDGKGCSTAADCLSGVCPASKLCAVPACTDTVKNGTETDVDC